MLAMNYSPALWVTDQKTTTYARLGKQPKPPDAEPSSIGNYRIGLTTGLSPLVKPTLEMTAMTSNAPPLLRVRMVTKSVPPQKTTYFAQNTAEDPCNLALLSEYYDDDPIFLPSRYTPYLRGDNRCFAVIG